MTPLFTEVTTTLGFTEAETLWQTGTYALPEVIGSGVALFDYDNDEALDILHVRFPPPDVADIPCGCPCTESTFSATI